MKNLLIMGTLLFSMNSFAGNEKGNGGGVHFCGVEERLELYDIYEAQARYGYKIVDKKLSVENTLQFAVDKISKNNSFIGRKVKEQIDYLKNSHMIVRAKVKLTPIGDANILLTDEGCSYKQLANWDEVSGNLIIKKEYFDQMDNLNKAAFLIHETLYKVGRDLNLLEQAEDGSTTSDTVRMIVGEIFSTNNHLDTLWTYNLDTLQEAEKKRQEEISGKYLLEKTKYEESVNKLAAIEKSGLNKCSSDYVAARTEVEMSLIAYKIAMQFMASDFSLKSGERVSFLAIYMGLSTSLSNFENESNVLAGKCRIH
jgi:hypothetical protein